MRLKNHELKNVLVQQQNISLCHEASLIVLSALKITNDSETCFKPMCHGLAESTEPHMSTQGWQTRTQVQTT